MDEGLIVPVNPIEGLRDFAVEFLFNPSPEGDGKQRFVQFQDKKRNRCLIAQRLNADKEWYLDSYLHVEQIASIRL